MKFRPNKYHTGIAVYAFLVIAAAILFYKGLQNIGTLLDAAQACFRFIEPVIFGSVFAYLLNPLLRLYDDRFLKWASRDRLQPRARRAVGLLLTYPTVLVVIAAFLALVIPQLAVSIYGLFALIPYYAESLQDLYTGMAQTLANFQVQGRGTELEPLVNNMIHTFTGSMEGLLASAYLYLTGLVPGLISAGAKFTGQLLNVILGIIISIYFLYDREKLFAQTRKVSVALFSPRTHNLLYDIVVDANRVFSGYIVGTIIDSAIMGILCYIGTSLMQMPFAMLISVIVGATNVIPYFGPFIGVIPGALIILMTDPRQALLFVVFILILQQFDGNIIAPKILGDSTGLSALWVVFAIMLFGGIFGVAGMFIGVPLFAVFYHIVKRFVAYLLLRKNLSQNTRDYASEKNPLIK